MNIAEILRKLADALEGAEQPEVEPPVVAATSDCGCGGEPEMAPQDEPAAPEGDEATWMPPQTQEMELLKKMAGEPGEFDGGHETGSEIDDLKRLAGITAIKR